MIDVPSLLRGTGNGVCQINNPEVMEFEKRETEKDEVKKENEIIDGKDGVGTMKEAKNASETNMKVEKNGLSVKGEVKQSDESNELKQSNESNELKQSNESKQLKQSSELNEMNRETHSQNANHSSKGENAVQTDISAQSSASQMEIETSQTPYSFAAVSGTRKSIQTLFTGESESFQWELQSHIESPSKEESPLANTFGSASSLPEMKMQDKQTERRCL